MNLCVWIGRRRSLWPSHRARRRHVDRDDSLARGIDRTLAQDERCWKRKRTTRREREREREDLRRRRAQRKLVMKKHPRSWHHSHHYHHHHHHHKFRVFLFCFQYLRPPPTHTHTHPPVGCSRSFLSGSRVRPGTLALAARCCHVVCRETAVLSQVVTSWKEGTERAHGADEAANQFGSGRRRKRTEKENRPRLGVVSSSSSRGHAHAKTSLPFFQRSM